MNVYELFRAVIEKRGCSQDLLAGASYDYMADMITGCDECRGCEFGRARGGTDGGLIGGELGFRLVMDGAQSKLVWNCPACGAQVHEDTTPIAAIDKSQEVAADPLCFICRKKLA